MYNGNSYKVTAVGNGAFANCKKLKTVTIGKNVSKIGGKAFYNCKKLKRLTIQSKKLTAKKVGKKAFKGTHPKISVKVPKGKKKTYKKWLRSKGIGMKARIQK